MKKLINKSILILVVVSLLICGCTPNVKKNSETNESETITFNNLNDNELQDYIIETLSSGINANFYNDDYTIDTITTTYVSKEYLDEVAYNTKSNVYFGYNLEELSKEFNGKKYVFTVGDNNKTVVNEFEDYNDVYNKMIKNVALGTGVILICTTISVASTGTSVAIIFAVAAKDATTVGLSSAGISGTIAAAVEYYNTGNLEESLEKGLLEASESFKWGTIIGGTTGGISETVKQVNAAQTLKTMNVHEKGLYSEGRALKKYGGTDQVSYLNGKEVKLGTENATRPDIVRTVDGKLEAIEVKNYNLNIKENRKHLIKELKRQITDRTKHLPEGTSQRVVLDVQGRNYDKKLIDGIIKGIQESCKDVYPNLPVDIMY